MHAVSRYSVHRWVILIGGFGQTQGQQTALEGLQEELRCCIANDDCIVRFESWKNNVSDLAQTVFNYGGRDITIIGYSYGGHSATLLAKELTRRGAPVKNLVLIDAVWRYLSYFPSILSLLPFWKIKPPFVGNLRAWRQFQSIPRGHKVVAHPKQPPNTVTISRLFRDHGFCDDAAEVHEYIRELLGIEPEECCKPPIDEV